MFYLYNFDCISCINILDRCVVATGHKFFNLQTSLWKGHRYNEYVERAARPIPVTSSINLANVSSFLIVAAIIASLRAPNPGFRAIDRTPASGGMSEGSKIFVIGWVSWAQLYMPKNALCLPPGSSWGWYLVVSTWSFLPVESHPRHQASPGRHIV